MDRARELAECPICFETLASAPVACLAVQPGKRSCGHYLHKHCAEALRNARPKCPLCRADFSTVEQLEPLDRRDPRRWFRSIDADGDGELSRFEVSEALKASCDLDWQRLDADLEKLWPRWDRNGDGKISYTELCGGSDSLLGYIDLHYASQRVNDNVPPLAQAREWFAYWDEDNGGSLSKAELRRALIKTYKLQTVGKIRAMTETIEAVWGIFDTDGSDEIDMAEFSAPGGLAEALVAAREYEAQANL